MTSSELQQQLKASIRNEFREQTYVPPRPRYLVAGTFYAEAADKLLGA